MSEPPRPPSGYNPYGGGEPGRRQHSDPTAQWQGPTGQWQQQPSGQWQGPPGEWQQQSAPRKRSKVVPLVVGAMLLAVVATGGGLYLAGAFSTEIRTETVAYAAADAFTTPVGQGAVLPVAQTASAAPPAATAAVSGGQVGLYGGTGNDKVCDKEQLVAFLEQDPAKAAAWAQIEGIQVSRIRDYVATLTPVLLRSDTAVTNHGFRNGVANPINSVLQAGTAVLVDNLGVPRARCLCGNPLAEGKQFSRSSYTGSQWAGFDQTRIAVVRPAPSPVTSFTLVDVRTNSTYTQTAGASSAVAGPAVPGTPKTSSAKTTSPRTSTARPGTGQVPQPQGGAQQQQSGGAAQQQTRVPASSAAPAGGGKTCLIPGGGRVKEGDSFDVGGTNYVMGPGCKPTQG